MKKSLIQEEINRIEKEIEEAENRIEDYENRIGSIDSWVIEQREKLDKMKEQLKDGSTR